MSAGNGQKGFTLVGALIMIGVMGAGLAAYGELASHAAQREKERELVFVGNQFRQAIAGYYERSPGGAKRYPQKLEELLEDKRYPMPQRYLRRMYADPITGKPQWGLVEAPGGGIMGVYSLSEAAPIKTAGFGARDSLLEGAVRYSQWHFSYAPLGVSPPQDAKKTPSG
jgi:type II secretory pathway pseudopilin PulG